MDLMKVVWLGKGSSDFYTEVDWTRDHSKISAALARLVNGPGSFVMQDIRVVNSLDELVWWWKDGKVQH
jgi:hypothetical protein